MNYLTLNAAQVKQEAKALKIKNWWKLDKQSLLCDIAVTLGWKAEDGIPTRDFLLSGKKITVGPAPGETAPEICKETAASVSVKKARKPRKVAKKSTADKPAKAPKTTLPEGWVTLAELCEQNDIKPTVARRRLRNAGESKDATHGWAWEAPATNIVKIIKGEK